MAKQARANYGELFRQFRDNRISVLQQTKLMERVLAQLSMCNPEVMSTKDVRALLDLQIELTKSRLSCLKQELLLAEKLMELACRGGL
jgi:hypothetical protein